MSTLLVLSTLLYWSTIGFTFSFSGCSSSCRAFTTVSLFKRPLMTLGSHSGSVAFVSSVFLLALTKAVLVLFLEVALGASEVEQMKVYSISSLFM